MNMRRILERTLAAATVAASAFAAHAQTIEIKTSMGTITAELYGDRAPITVENFMQYVKAGFYNGTVFHRVIPTFMIQGGGFTPDMQQKKTRAPVAHEGRGAFAKGAKNETGTLAMARTGDPDSATAQFFINVQDNEFLNPALLPDGDPVTFNYQGRMVTASRAQALPATAGYTVFGRITKGMDVVERIKAVPTATTGMHQDVPVKPVVIESIKLADLPKK
jgi:peptidyl-prolyl cis-trans isomerase A (cyclophilin A)